jgi:hypothetical protein
VGLDGCAGGLGSTLLRKVSAGEARSSVGLSWGQAKKAYTKGATSAGSCGRRPRARVVKVCESRPSLPEARTEQTPRSQH